MKEDRGWYRYHNVENYFESIEEHIGYIDMKWISEKDVGELPADSPFESKDVSALCYLASGVQKVEENPDYPQYRNFLEAVRKTGGNEAVEQYAMKNLMINGRRMARFTLENSKDDESETEHKYRLDGRGISEDYAEEMTQEYRHVMEAVGNYDLDALADICKRGLDITRSAWNQKETTQLVDRYEAGHVCGQVLDMLERNQELKEKVGLTPEDYNYYRGMARVSDIIREGAKAGEMLTAPPQELTPEQKAEYEKAYSRYRDLSIMTSLEIRNRAESPEQQQLTAQLAELAERPDVQQELRERNVMGADVLEVAANVANTASARNSEVIRRLGESGGEQFFEELHELAETARVTGKAPGYDNLNEEQVKGVVFGIDHAEGTFYNTDVLGNGLPEERRLVTLRRDFIQENPKFQGPFQTGIDASIKELDKADSPLVRSSPQYKEMQAAAKYMSEAMQTVGKPLTYYDVRRLRSASEELTQRVEAYKQHKEINYTGSKQELARIAAADKLKRFSGQIEESLSKLSQGYSNVPELRAQKIADMRAQEFKDSFQTEINESIKELKKADSSLFRGGSPEYKEMQARAERMSKVMGTIGNPMTDQDFHHLRSVAEEMNQGVEAYKQYKEIHHTGSKWELARIAAADKLMQLGERMAAGLGKMGQDLETVQQLRAQQTAREARQKEGIAALRAHDSSVSVPAEEGEQQRAQREAVGKEVIDHMNKRYGKDAPPIYRTAGSMMEVKMKNGEQRTVSAVEHLGKNIMKYKTDVAIYINGGVSPDKNHIQHLRNTMARMVAMENIVAERVINRYQPGQKTVAPGPQESAYAKDPTTYLKEIVGTKSFQKAVEKMTPEKMKDFVLNDGAAKLVRSMHQEAVEKSQREKKVSKEKNVNKEMEAAKKTAPAIGQ